MAKKTHGESELARQLATPRRWYDPQTNHPNLLSLPLSPFSPFPFPSPTFTPTDPTEPERAAVQVTVTHGGACRPCESLGGDEKTERGGRWRRGSGAAAAREENGGGRILEWSCARVLVLMLVLVSSERSWRAAAAHPRPALLTDGALLTACPNAKRRRHPRDLAARIWSILAVLLNDGGGGGASSPALTGDGGADWSWSRSRRSRSSCSGIKVGLLHGAPWDARHAERKGGCALLPCSERRPPPRRRLRGCVAPSRLAFWKT
uniref:Uncharacterized protein n=1 Tax=Oryza nivara TaxID=4536 RepID=A0A0E0GSL4_ORYNI